ncbi:MAG: calcium/sodium antiporter [Alphaproteobacteria bacterium]
MMLWSFLLVVGGLAVLLFSGDLLVRGAVALARSVRIPPLIIGLTVVAFGTSAPELFIGIDAAIIGGEALGIALGNVVGSNIANVLLVLGLPALIAATMSKQNTIRRNTIIMIAASLVFVALCLDGRQLTFLDGAMLFGLILIFLLWSAMRARRARRLPDDLGEMAELDALSGLPRRLPVILICIVVSLIGLPLGAHMIVKGGTELARAAGVAPSVIGLSLVAIGTSLPELATTVVAAMRKHSAVALGNVIGSNLFNLLAIMGVTAMVSRHPIPIEGRILNMDLWIMLASSAVVLFYVALHRPIGRLSGVLFLGAYGAYLAFLFVNGEVG